jgi:hypothetical protein
LSVIEGPSGRIEIEPRESRGPILRRSPDAELRDATRRHLENFFESVRTRKRPNAPVSVVLPATLICQMANLSIAANRPARWDAGLSRVEI